MKTLYIQPITKPPFWEIEDFISANIPNQIDYNVLFWEHFSSVTRFKELFLEEIWRKNMNLHEYFLIVKRGIEKSYATFKESRDKDIEITDLLEATYVFSHAFYLISSQYRGLKLGFSREVMRLDPVLGKEFLLPFFQKNLINEASDAWFFPIYTKKAFVQIQSLYKAMEKAELHHLLPKKIIISLTGLLEYEEKNATEKYIKENLVIPIPFEFIHKRNDVPKEFYKTLHKGRLNMLGKKMGYIQFFSKNCPWRRCTFCNIGKGYSYSSLSIEKKIQSIQEKIELIKKEKLDVISISDPSITTAELKLVAKTFKSQNFSIPIHIRTRYSRELLNPEFAKELYETGIRYMGIGLEAGSERINRLIDKYNIYPSLEEVEKMTEVCINAGIKVHHYVIIGFPTETREELDITKNFLFKMMDRFGKDFYTYTASKFFLSEESYIYKNPEKFGITLTDKTVNQKIAMTEPYEEKDATEELKAYRDATFEMLQFHSIFGLQYAYKENIILIDNIWGVMERMGILWAQKSSYTKNPYITEDVKKWLISKGLYKENI